MKTWNEFVNEQPLEEKNWIQSAFKDVEKRGTEGKCTGKNFGGRKCPPGSKQYNMAKNLRKIAKHKKKED